MGIVAGACALLLILTTVFHYEVLRLLSAALGHSRIPARLRLVAVIITAFAAHFVEILLYGLAYYWLIELFKVGGMGEPGFLPFTRCLYFSAETYTTLGYGDVLPHGDLRLLAGLEALNGMLLMGWTASYTYLSMERLWGDGPSGPSGPAGKG